MIKDIVFSRKLLRNIGLLKHIVNKNILKIGITSTGITNILGMENKNINQNINREIENINGIHRYNRYYYENQCVEQTNKNNSYIPEIKNIKKKKSHIFSAFNLLISNLNIDINIFSECLKEINKLFEEIQTILDSINQENRYQNVYFYETKDVNKINDNEDKRITKCIHTNNLKTVIFNDINLSFNDQKESLREMNRKFIIKPIILKHKNLIDNLNNRIRKLNTKNIKNINDEKINILVNNLNNIFSIFLDKNTEMAIDFFLKDKRNDFIKNYDNFANGDILTFNKLNTYIEHKSTEKTYVDYINKILSVNNQYRMYANTSVLRYFLEKIATNNIYSEYYYNILEKTFLINSPVEFTNFIIKNKYFNFLETVKNRFFKNNIFYFNCDNFKNTKIINLKLINKAIININKSLKIQLNFDNPNIIIEEDFVSFNNYNELFDKYKTISVIIKSIQEDLPISKNKSTLLYIGSDIYEFNTLYEYQNLFYNFLFFKSNLRKIANNENNENYKQLLNNIKCGNLIEYFNIIEKDMKIKLKSSFYIEKLKNGKKEVIENYSKTNENINKKFKIKI